MRVYIEKAKYARTTERLPNLRDASSWNKGEGDGSDE